jgi:hypothetical protein
MFGKDDRVKTIGALVRSNKPPQTLLLKEMAVKKAKQEENNISVI